MSILYYNIFIILTLSFSHLSSRVVESQKKIVNIVVFLLLMLFSALRFDVGPDYEEYVKYFYAMSSGVEWSWPRYYSGLLIFNFLSWIFSNWEFGYVYVFAVYSFLNTSILFLAISRYSNQFSISVTKLLFVFIAMGYYLDSLDRIRQWTAILICFYAYSYILRGKYLYFISLVCCASVFHFSAIFTLLFIPLSSVSINRKTFGVIFIFILLLQYTGFGNIILDFAIKNTPYYSDKYLDKEFVNGFFVGSGLGVLLKISILLCSILSFKQADDNKTANIVFTGLSLYIMSSGNLNIMRISDYFCVFSVITIPFFFDKLYQVKRGLFYLFTIILIVYYQSLFMRNNFTYKTILSEEFNYQQFEMRSER